MEFKTTINVEPVMCQYRCYVLPGITRAIIEENGWRRTGVVSPTGYGYIRSGEEYVGVAVAGKHKGELFILQHTNDKRHQGHFHFDKVYYKHD